MTASEKSVAILRAELQIAYETISDQSDDLKQLRYDRRIAAERLMICKAMFIAHLPKEVIEELNDVIEILK